MRRSRSSVSDPADPPTAPPAPGVTADPADEAALREYARALAEAVPPALQRWVRRSVDRVVADSGRSADEALRNHTELAAQRCAGDIGAQVRALLDTDIAEQRGTPLDLLRCAVAYPTSVLSEAGFAPVQRDEFDVRVFPDDRYGLTPASFADIDESLHEPGLYWGAAKAHVHLARRRAADSA